MDYAEVAVNVPTPSRGTFSYRVPSDLDVSPGHGVWVPFGPRKVQGIVMELVEVPAVEEVRDIHSLLEPHPLLSPAQLRLTRWMAQRYFTPLFQTAVLFLPPAFRRGETPFARLTDRGTESFQGSLPPSQREVVDYLRKRGSVAVATLRQALGSRGVSALTLLERQGLAQRESRQGETRVRPRTVRFLEAAVTGVALEEALTELWGRGHFAQAHLLELLGETGHPMSQAEALRRTGTEATAATALQRKGLIRGVQRRMRRDPLADVTYTPSRPLALTTDQSLALQEIVAALQGGPGEGRGRTFLLYGVTGSGKTEVYLQALAAAVRQGRRGIVLVPEIALTPQTIQRFWERFPGRVAVLHSKLSVGERYDEWWGIKEGLFDVVIGTRSALGASQPDLGLIILDEEHDPAYKQQDPAPRYQARDVARELARLTGAVLLLGSATPDLESYLHAKTGSYRLLSLPDRIASAEATGYRLQPRPQVEIIDMRQELKTGNTSIFSRTLAAALERALAHGEQAILFLNRRGSATSVQCRECGYLAQCPRCSTPFTFHAPSSLLCHQCNLRTSSPTHCPDCSSGRIRYLGVGTQRVAEEVSGAFPGARILRWDRDTSQGRGSHEAILAAFLRHDADVLVGTQMLAKGLHLPLVSLVGVVNADVGLHLPDFRAGEATFQILTQVAGRAGRSFSPGRAYIQTYNPDHYALRGVADQTYEAFYNEEIAFRRALGYPPFSRLVRLLYADPSFAAARRQAVRLFERLRQEIAVQGLPELEVIGPAPAYYQRVRGRYRWHLLLKGRDPARLLADFPLPEGWIVDVDPVNLL